MTINKNTDLEFSLQKGTEKGGVYTNFYTEDKGSASIRIRLSNNGYYLDLTKTDLKPVLFLFHEDGSIFEIRDFINVMPDKGLIQYNLSDNVVAHAGKVNAKLFLKNTEQSVHVANFTFDIKDSGIEGAVEKEINVNLVDDAVRKIMEANPEDYKGKDADPNDVKDLLIPYTEEKVTEEFEKLSSAKQQDAEVIQARASSDNLKERLNNSNYLPNKNDVNRSVISKSTTNKPMVTFIDDDGRLEVLEKWEPILKEKGNKLTVAVVGLWVDNKASTVMQWDTIHRLNREYGVEFVSHTLEHKHALQITDEEVDNEFRENKKILQREGLTHDIIVQPFGENTDSVRRISRNYAKANVSTKEGVNTLPLDTFRLFRITLGEDLYTTWEQYKEILDDAISKNAWVIFKSHSQYESFNENQLQLIRQIIDYCRENDFIEATMEEGLEDRGNLIDVGDYTKRAQGSDYYILDKNGDIHSRKYEKHYNTLTYNSVSFNTPATNFADRTTSSVAIVSSTAQGFPNNSPGQLITTKSESIGLSYQLYLPNNSNIVYKRRWDTKTSAWTSFESITPITKELLTRQYTNNTSLNAQSTADVIITNHILDGMNFNVGDTITGTTETPLPSGVMYNVFITEKNKITVRYSNITTEKITIPATFYNFRITYK